MIDNATINGVNFTESDLSGSTFQNAKGKWVNFEGCNLLNCNFQNAILDQAIICSTKIDKTTNFRGASLINIDGDETRDNRGKLTSTAVDWRWATYDATTIYGTNPNALALEIIENAIAEIDVTQPVGIALLSKLENLKSNPRDNLHKKIGELMEAVSSEEKELLDEVLDEAYKLI